MSARLPEDTMTLQDRSGAPRQVALIDREIVERGYWDAEKKTRISYGYVIATAVPLPAEHAGGTS
jgi:hypothetical protein